MLIEFLKCLATVAERAKRHIRIRLCLTGSRLAEVERGWRVLQAHSIEDRDRCMLADR